MENEDAGIEELTVSEENNHVEIRGRQALLLYTKLPLDIAGGLFSARFKAALLKSSRPSRQHDLDASDLLSKLCGSNWQCLVTLY